MAKEDLIDLLNYLTPFPVEIRDKVLWLREFIWDQYPEANELIYDNYNAVAIGWSVTDRLSHTFCSIAVYRSNCNIHFGFYWGNEVPDPQKLLIGKGKQYRYLLVKDLADLPKNYLSMLMMDAFINSQNKVKDPKQIVHGQTVSKTIVPVKKREVKN